MIVKKVTAGRVVQTFDLERDQCLSQEFTPHNTIAYQNEDGSYVDEKILVKGELPGESEHGMSGFPMRQPDDKTTSMLWMLQTVISSTFKKEVGLEQYSKPEEERRGMLVRFHIHDITRDNHGDSRYPQMELFLYASHRGVTVLTREYVTHKYDDCPEDVTREESEWIFHSDHDVCWRDALRNILHSNDHRIDGLQGSFNLEVDHCWEGQNELPIPCESWYYKVPVSHDRYRSFRKTLRKEWEIQAEERRKELESREG